MATTLDGALVALIQNSAPLMALIGSGDTARIYPSRIPQTAEKSDDGHALPAIAFLKVGAVRVSAFGDDTGMVRDRYQFSCWADKYTDARNLAEGLRATLQRYRDAAGAGGVVIQDCFLIGDSMTYDETVDSHGVLVDYEIIWMEGV